MLVFTTTDCPISNRYAPEIQRLPRSSASKREFVLVYPVAGRFAGVIRAHHKKFGYSIESLRDTGQQLVKQTGVTVTPEVAVMRWRSRWCIAAASTIAMSSSAWSVRKPTPHDLEDALDAVIAGKPVATRETRAVGCILVGPDQMKRRRSESDGFSRRCAPAALVHCATAVALPTLERARRHVLARHRADRVRRVRVLSSRRRARPLSAHHLRRSPPPRHADRAGHAQPLHAAVESRAGRRPFRRPAAADRPGRSRRSTSGRRTARREGDPRDLPPLPKHADGWLLGKPDLIVKPDAAFTLPAQQTDAFRIFAIRCRSRSGPT